MKVSEAMNRRVISVSPDDSISSAARLMSRYNVGALPVCSRDSRLRGIVTDRDVVTRCVALDMDPDTTPVREIMTRRVSTAEQSEEIAGAAGKMGSEQVRRLPVVQEGRVVGILSLGDVARRSEYDMEAAKALSEISENIRRI
ncbi:MAG: CBS domain-containing protein [Oscillospiraceae bacterium]|nr:CBS domain-containing protein [Oscillospiraceae bacterium]